MATLIGARTASTTGTTTSALDTTGATLLVAVCRYSGSPASPITDSKGNTWTALGGANSYLGLSGRMMYCVSPASVGAGHTWTVPAGVYEMAVAAFSGTGAFDSAVNATYGVPAASATGGPLNPINNNTLLIGGIHTYNSAADLSAPVVGGPWTETVALNPAANAIGVALAHLELGAHVSTSVTWSWSGGNAAGTAGIAAFALAADTTAPVLSSSVGTATGAAAATIGATTDEGNGTLFGFVSVSATPPSATDLKAGTGAVWAGSVAVASTGAKTLSATGLTASTAYHAHLIHTDAATNNSNIVTSAQFTTDAAPPASSIAVIFSNYRFRRA